MERSLRVLLALCAPTALVSFVHPGTYFKSFSSSWVQSRAAALAPSAGSLSPKANDSPRPCHQRRRTGRGVEALHATSTPKPVPFEVTSKPAGNSSYVLSLDIPGRSTQLCYDRAVRAISKSAAGRIPGYSNLKNQKIPEDVIVRQFGREAVIGQALQVVTDSVIDEAVQKLDRKVIGSATLVQEPEALVQIFTPGEEFSMDVKIDVWPEVEITGEYTGFELTVEEPPIDVERVQAAWRGLLDRNVILDDTEEGYAAQMGDAVVANMVGYAQKEDGSRGDKLPEIASGEMVEVVLEEGRYMLGLAEGLEGVKAGEEREVRLSFPDKLGPAAGDLEGTKAVFEVEAVAVKKRRVPEMDDAFAESIRPGLTLEQLTQEVENAVTEETGSSKKDARFRALEDRLLQDTKVEIPETMIIEQAQQKFAIMMTELKNKGESDELIKGMISKENFETYVEIVRESVTRGLSLSLLMSHIAGKEGIEVDPREVTDQMDLARAQAKGEELNEDEIRDKIEASLERELVLDWITERSTINWTEAKPLEKQPATSPSP